MGEFATRAHFVLYALLVANYHNVFCFQVAPAQSDISGDFLVMLYHLPCSKDRHVGCRRLSVFGHATQAQFVYGTAGILF